LAALESAMKVIEALRVWCKDDPIDSYSEKLHDAIASYDEATK
jgi:hypothetical protein